MSRSRIAHDLLDGSSFRWPARLILASRHGLHWPVAFSAASIAGKTNSETARYSGEDNPPDERKLRIGETVTQLANELGRSASQVSLNWLRQRNTVVIPIIGARRAAQIEDNLKSLDWQLTNEQLAKLDDATKIELGFPHDFLTNDFVKQMVFGGTHASIDNHRR
jgi:aryl-alcohol dehydrogenase-like predicted oxidoreductase